MRRFRNPVLIGLTIAGAIASGVAVIDRTPLVPATDSVQHCILNADGETFTYDEAVALIEFYKKELELMGGLTALNVTGCDDLFDRLDTSIINRLDSGGGGVTIEDLTPSEYRALLEVLLIKRSNANNDRIKTLRGAVKESPARLSEF